MNRPNNNTSHYNRTVTCLHYFIDFEKTFDSLDRETTCKLMRHYGMPEKFISIIKTAYKRITCRILHEGKITYQFEVKTGNN